MAIHLKSDEDSMIYRRLGQLQARLLLMRQNEIAYLEQELDDLDVRSRRARGDPDRPKQYAQSQNHSAQNLSLQHICEKLSIYGEHGTDNEGIC